MNKAKLMIIALAAGALAACSSDDGEEGGGVWETPKTTRALTIEVSENPLINPDAAAKAPRRAPRRAPVTTTSTLSAFYLQYIYSTFYSETAINAVKDGDGKWQNQSGKDMGWPSNAAEDNSTVKWYAYTDGTFNHDDLSNPYLSFTADESSSSTKDLLIATVSDTWANCNGRLSLTFDHACTALRFYVKKAANLSDYTLTVSDIQLCNVKNQGNYYFATSSWDGVGGKASYTLHDFAGGSLTLGTEDDYQVLNLGNTTAAEDDDYLFLIPQELTAWDTTTDIASTTGTYIQLTCTISKDGSNKFDGTAYIPFGGTALVKGYQHNVGISIGKNSLYSAANTKIITE